MSINGYKVYNVKKLQVKEFKLRYIFFRPKTNMFYVSCLNLPTLEYVALKLKDLDLKVVSKKVSMTQGLGPFEAQYMHKIDSQHINNHRIIKAFPLLYFIKPKGGEFLKLGNKPEIIQYFNHFHKNLTFFNYDN
jgi:hypothetical protein